MLSKDLDEGEAEVAKVVSSTMGVPERTFILEVSRVEAGGSEIVFPAEVALDQALIDEEGEIAGIEGRHDVVQTTPEEKISPEHVTENKNSIFRPQGQATELSQTTRRLTR